MVRSAPGPFREALGFGSRHCHAVGQAERSEPWAPGAVEDRVGRLGVEFAFPAVLGLPGGGRGRGSPHPPQSPPPGLGQGLALCCPDCGAFASNGRKDLNSPLGKGAPLGPGIGDRSLHRLPLRGELLGIKGVPPLESFFFLSPAPVLNSGQSKSTWQIRPGGSLRGNCLLLKCMLWGYSLGGFK